MSHFNPNIELSVADMELIEDALHIAKQQLSKHSDGEGNLRSARRSVRDVDALLGHLHNQKVFFRPTNKPYVGG